MRVSFVELILSSTFLLARTKLPSNSRSLKVSRSSHAKLILVVCTFLLYSTINEYFGSRIMTKNGIILNNEMADFSIPGVTKIDGAGLPVVSRKIQPFNGL